MEAIDKVLAAVAGIAVGTVKVKTSVRDEDGDFIYRDVLPLAKPLPAKYVFALADLIPKGSRTQVVKDLRLGTIQHDGERLVTCQAQCLRHLVDEAQKVLAAQVQALAPVAEPAKE